MRKRRTQHRASRQRRLSSRDSRRGAGAGFREERQDGAPIAGLFCYGAWFEIPRLLNGSRSGRSVRAGATGWLQRSVPGGAGRGPRRPVTGDFHHEEKVRLWGSWGRGSGDDACPGCGARGASRGCHLGPRSSEAGAGPAAVGDAQGAPLRGGGRRPGRPVGPARGGEEPQVRGREFAFICSLFLGCSLHIALERELGVRASQKTPRSNGCAGEEHRLGGGAEAAQCRCRACDLGQEGNGALPLRQKFTPSPVWPGR